MYRKKMEEMSFHGNGQCLNIGNKLKEVLKVWTTIVFSVSRKAVLHKAELFHMHAAFAVSREKSFQFAFNEHVSF